MTIARLPLLAALLLCACGGPTPDGNAGRPPLAGAAIGGPFTLIDQHGKTVTDRSFAGQYRIMYFGYTFCPDVCPTDVQTLAAGLREVEASEPALAARIVPIFVTVDPERDTPKVVGAFVGAFHPRMVGLTGSPAAIAAIEKEYAVYAAPADRSAAGAYLVNHSRQAYLMDPDGKPLALLSQDQGPKAVAAELKRWVK